MKTEAQIYQVRVMGFELSPVNEGENHDVLYVPKPGI